ncbi:MAG: hypothetical protein HQ522_11815 [Bacteroidetes bacterium]|nr:hypothetical protein [Bacteroidota bacterium]
MLTARGGLRNINYFAYIQITLQCTSGYAAQLRMEMINSKMMPESQEPVSSNKYIVEPFRLIHKANKVHFKLAFVSS